MTAFLVYLSRGQVLLSGDAVAHIVISRRLFDSLTPGILQHGTVWLPLQHLLTAPFVWNDWMWRSGLGGSIPSMAGYVLAVLGIFRLVRTVLRRTVLAAQARAAAWLAAVIVAANPNLLYLQSTALNEALYLAGFIWTAVFLEQFVVNMRGQGAAARTEAARALERCAMLLAAAMLLRYDGWFLTMAVGAAVLVVLVRSRGAERGQREAGKGRLLAAVARSALLCAAIPLLWLAYNYREFGNPLEFATGPDSARGIMQRTTRAGDPPHPGHHDPRVAALYFLKAAKLNLGEGRWQSVLLWLALLGSGVALLTRTWTWLLLWAPLPFYALSVTYSGVPIFLPVWWPFSYYNTRYGIHLLPAAAAFTALLAAFLLNFSHRRRWRWGVIALTAGLVAGSYASVWQAQPLDLREIIVNSRDRIAYEEKLAAVLEGLPRSSRLLMYAGDHGDALRRAGIPMRRVVTETNHPQWEQALGAPPEWVDYLVAPEGGAAGGAAQRHRQYLEPIATIESPGKPRTVVYRVKRSTTR